MKNDKDRARRLEKIQELDDESAGEIVPRSYMDDVYKLRRDIDLVRRRIEKSSDEDGTHPASAKPVKERK